MMKTENTTKDSVTFQNRIEDLIRNRTSVRTYWNRMLTPKDADGIEAILSELNSGPLGSSVRFKLAASRPGDREALKGLGTYGMIWHPAGFVIGAVLSAALNLGDRISATRLMAGAAFLGAALNAAIPVLNDPKPLQGLAPRRIPHSLEQGIGQE